MRLLRTPDERFENLPGYDFEPHYIEVDGVRIHYLDEGPREAPPVLLMHGEPSWCYLYRKMVPPLVAAGFRVVAPDLVGFGRSDKPAEREDYSYQRHVDWMRGVVEGLDLQGITMFCQDWGGLIGLRLLAEQMERFTRVVAANTFLPTGEIPLGKAFEQWREHSQTTPVFNIGKIIDKGTVNELAPEVRAAYDAPFPDESYKAGARVFPALVPNTPDDPASAPNKQAWKALYKCQLPFLTAFSDSDPITKGGDMLLRMAIPGCQGQSHTTIEAAGHFLQEDKGEELAQLIIDFVAGSE